MTELPTSLTTCFRCGELPAQVCDECRRACALKWFSGISRHPEVLREGEVACRVCEDGTATWCGRCWADAVSRYREELRTHIGREIGRWPDYPDTEQVQRASDNITRAFQAGVARGRQEALGEASQDPT